MGMNGKKGTVRTTSWRPMSIYISTPAPRCPSLWSNARLPSAVNAQPEPEMRQPDDIQRESFRIIEQEVSPHHFPPEQWQVVQRVIHSTADFEYAELLRFHPQAFAVAEAAIRQGEDILTDVQMVRMGIQPLAERRHGIRVRCHLSDQEMSEAVRAMANTRTARGLLWGLTAGPVGVCVIGNAPTALRAAIDTNNPVSSGPSSSWECLSASWMPPNPNKPCWTCRISPGSPAPAAKVGVRWQRPSSMRFWNGYRRTAPHRG